MKLILIFTSALAIVNIGCVSGSYLVVADGMAEKPTAGARVFILDQTSKSALERKTYEPYVKAAVKMAGYQVVSKPSDAEYFINFNYGMTAQEKVRQRPMYRWNAPKTYNYNSTTQGAYGSYRSSGTVTEGGTGQLEVVGTRSDQYSEYTRVVRLQCVGYEAAAESFVRQQPAPETWTLLLTSSGYSADFRNALPVMLSAAVKYMGKDTKGQVQIDINRPDSELIKLAEDEILVRDPSSVP